MRLWMVAEHRLHAQSLSKTAVPITCHTFTMPHRWTKPGTMIYSQMKHHQKIGNEKNDRNKNYTSVNVCPDAKCIVSILVRGKTFTSTVGDTTYTVSGKPFGTSTRCNAHRTSVGRCTWCPSRLIHRVDLTQALWWYCTSQPNDTPLSDRQLEQD